MRHSHLPPLGCFPRLRPPGGLHACYPSCYHWEGADRGCCGSSSTVNIHLTTACIPQTVRWFFSWLEYCMCISNCGLVLALSAQHLHTLYLAPTAGLVSGRGWRRILWIRLLICLGIPHQPLVFWLWFCQVSELLLGPNFICRRLPRGCKRRFCWLWPTLVLLHGLGVYTFRVSFLLPVSSDLTRRSFLI